MIFEVLDLAQRQDDISLAYEPCSRDCVILKDVMPFISMCNTRSYYNVLCTHDHECKSHCALRALLLIYNILEYLQFIRSSHFKFRQVTFATLKYQNIYNNIVIITNLIILIIRAKSYFD